MSPRVTVLMSVFNGQRYLAESVESVLAQSFRDFELLVIDDGSTDDSPALLAAYAAKDPRVRVVRHENRGQNPSLNRGLELARSELIARADADDTNLPGRLERQVAFLDAHPEVDICGAWCTVLEPGGKKTLRRLPLTHTAIKSRLFVGTALVHPTVMYRRESMRRADLAYDNALLTASDYDLWVRASRLLTLANVPEPLLLYRMHVQQMTVTESPELLRSTDAIRSRQLRELLPECSPEQERLHLDSLWALPMGQERLARAGEWFTQLEMANAGRGLFLPAAFRNTLGQCWFELCAATAVAGGPGVAAYLQSPLRRWHNPALPVLGRAALRVARARLLRRR